MFRVIHNPIINARFNMSIKCVCVCAHALHFGFHAEIFRITVDQQIKKKKK